MAAATTKPATSSAPPSSSGIPFWFVALALLALASAGSRRVRR